MGPPLRSSGQGSWIQIQRSGFDFRCYQIFWEVMDLERGPLSLVSTTEELLGRKSSDCGLEIRQYGRRNLLRWPRGTLYPRKVKLTSPTSGGRSVVIVRMRTQATEFVFSLVSHYITESWGNNKKITYSVEHSYLELSDPWHTDCTFYYRRPSKNKLLP
jgi:hypothetical protein